MAINRLNIKQGFKSSVILGWKIETNWSNLFTVFIVKCSKPFAVALMLTAMYTIASGPNSNKDDLAWAITGVCVWSFIQSATELYSYAIIGEREWFRNIINIITAPTPLSVYLLGRTLIWLPIGIINFIIIILISNSALNFGLNVSDIKFGYLIISLLFGFGSVVGLGFLVAGISLITPRFSEGIAFGVTGALYLLSGSIIKPALLPASLMAISNALPFTHWIEIIRYCMFSYFRYDDPPLTNFLISSIIFCCMSYLIYKYCLYKGRQSGKIELSTMF